MKSTKKEKPYSKEIQEILACPSTDPKFIEAIKGLKVIIGETSEETLKDLRKSLRYTSAILYSVVNDTKTLQDLNQSHIGDESIELTIVNMTQLRHDVETKASKIDDYLARKAKVRAREASMNLSFVSQRMIERRKKNAKEKNNGTV